MENPRVDKLPTEKVYHPEKTGRTLGLWEVGPKGSEGVNLHLPGVGVQYLEGVGYIEVVVSLRQSQKW